MGEWAPGISWEQEAVPWLVSLSSVSDFVPEQ